MAKPKVTVNPVANQYTGDNERIIEFSDRDVGAGGLIAFRRVERPDGQRRLMVQLYRCDPTVDVTVGRPDVATTRNAPLWRSLRRGSAGFVCSRRPPSMRPSFSRWRR